MCVAHKDFINMSIYEGRRFKGHAVLIPLSTAHDRIRGWHQESQGERDHMQSLDLVFEF